MCTAINQVTEVQMPNPNKAVNYHKQLAMKEYSKGGPVKTNYEKGGGASAPKPMPMKGGMKSGRKC